MARASFFITCALVPLLVFTPAAAQTRTLNVMLVGQSRNGKSAIGNTLFERKKVFQAKGGGDSTTRVIKTMTSNSKRGGVMIMGIDTPGFPDSGIKTTDGRTTIAGTADNLTALNYDMIVSYVNGDPESYKKICNQVLQLEKDSLKGEFTFESSKYHDFQGGDIPMPTFVTVHLALYPIKYGGSFGDVTSIRTVKDHALALQDLMNGPYRSVVVYNGNVSPDDEPENWDDVQPNEQGALDEVVKEQKIMNLNNDGGIALDKLFDGHIFSPHLKRMDRELSAPLNSTWDSLAQNGPFVGMPPATLNVMKFLVENSDAAKARAASNVDMAVRKLQDNRNGQASLKAGIKAADISTATCLTTGLAFSFFTFGITAAAGSACAAIAEATKNINLQNLADLERTEPTLEKELEAAKKASESEEKEGERIQDRYGKALKAFGQGGTFDTYSNSLAANLYSKASKAQLGVLKVTPLAALREEL